MRVSHFTDLEVWRRSHRLFLDVSGDVEAFPRRRAAPIVTDQTIRSVGSVGANIAEGYNRSKAKFLSSLDIAMGEVHETENWFYKIRDAGYLDRAIANRRIAESVEIGKMLSGLTKKIRTRP